MVRRAGDDEVGILWLSQFNGIDQQGQWILEDVNRDGIFDAWEDQINAGSGLPDLVLNWSNKVQLGAFDMSALFTGAFGHRLMNVTRKRAGLP
ncbi:MAG: hypothetical protein AAFO94_05150, partial [Bacteroidota bacterium]